MAIRLLRTPNPPEIRMRAARWAIPDDVEVDVVFFDRAELADREPPSATETTGSLAKAIATGNLRIAISNSAPDTIATTEISEDELSGVGGGHCAGNYCVSCGL